MKEFNIPNYGVITIKNIIFDINGTLQFKGRISEALIKKLDELKKVYNVYLISADTRGNLKELADLLKVSYIKINPKGDSEAEAKNSELIKLGKEVTVAIGNGNNDALMLQNSILGISILGSEGATTKSVLNSKVIFPNPLNAIDMLLDEKTMIGTLRS